jgi:hypothetical protein
MTQVLKNKLDFNLTLGHPESICSPNCLHLVFSEFGKKPQYEYIIRYAASFKIVVVLTTIGVADRMPKHFFTSL